LVISLYNLLIIIIFLKYFVNLSYVFFYFDLDPKNENELKRRPLQYRNLNIDGNTLLNCIRKVNDTEFHSYKKGKY
jgi:hypothetical protein